MVKRLHEGSELTKQRAFQMKTFGLSNTIKVERGVMESMVEEQQVSVSADPLASSPSQGGGTTSVTSVQNTISPSTSGVNIVHVTIPQTPTIQVQSVIQPTQQSVIQSATNSVPLQLSKGNVILVSKQQGSVIQTPSGSFHMIQAVDTASDESMSNEDDGVKKRREILARRPSYRKILNELGGGEIGTEDKGGSPTTSESSQDNEQINTVSIPASSYQTAGLLKVLPAGTIQIAASGTQGEVQGLHTLTMTNATTGGAIVQYAQQDGQFFVPGVVVASNTNSSSLQTGEKGIEDTVRKRELRLLKNREAARECRRKKKEYIKCLENRVAVLENQNKALIEELKSLKELYCQQKVE